MKSKKIKILLSTLAVLILLMILYPLAVFGRFKYAEAHSSYKQAISDREHITIVYREGCSRCRRTLPVFFLKHGLTTKKFYVLNAAKLNSTQLDKLDVHLTPVFRLDNTSFNTVNGDHIEKIWDKAK